MFCNILKFKKYLGTMIKSEDPIPPAPPNSAIWFNTHWPSSDVPLESVKSLHILCTQTIKYKHECEAL